MESGKRGDRPQLAEALHLCKVTGATLVIAKLDRLSRDAYFLLGLQKAGVKFVATDMPDANELTVGIMALVAQQEREAISRRTKEALAAAKKRGVQLGNPNGAKCLQGLGNGAAVAKVKELADSRANDLKPILEDIQMGGVTSVRGISEELNRRGMLTPRGKKWHPTSTARLLKRVQVLAE